MEKEFIPHEESLTLRELGFDEPCLGIYRKFADVARFEYKPNSINSDFVSLPTAPTWGAAFRWFRDNHGLIGLPRRDPSRNYNGWWFEIFEQKIKSDNPISLDDSDYINFDTYEEAEIACLKKLIEIAKETK